MAEQRHLISLTADEIFLLQRVLEMVEGHLSSCELNMSQTVLNKLDLKADYRHVERSNEVRLVALQVKKHGCEVPLTLFETACGKLYVRAAPNFAERYVPRT